MGTAKEDWTKFIELTLPLEIITENKGYATSVNETKCSHFFSETFKMGIRIIGQFSGS